MPNAYTGAFMRGRYFEVPSAVQIANPEHQEIGQTPELGWKDVHTAPHIDQDPQYELIGDDLWSTDTVSTEPGIVVDHTPVDHSHAGDHSLNEGSPQARYMRKDQHIRGPGETYEEKRWEDFGPKASEVSYEALMRGINSQPQNNPPLAMYDGKGFRYGYQDFLIRGRDRRFLAKQVRMHHGTRAVYPNTAYIPPDVAYDKRVPSWGSLASAIDKRIKRPMMRRSPTPLGDTIAEDGTSSPEDASSVIGVF
jgi:hypothetical protein